MTVAENDALIASIPAIIDADWNTSLSDTALESKMLASTNGTSVEFVMQDEARRRYVFGLQVARFFADYLDVYKGTWEHHKD